MPLMQSIFCNVYIKGISLLMFIYVKILTSQDNKAIGIEKLNKFAQNLGFAVAMIECQSTKCRQTTYKI